MKHRFTPEIRRQISQSVSRALKIKWRTDPDFASKVIRGLHTRPNKIEVQLDTLLNTSFPKQWKYVGGGEVIIGGKCPDFLNTDGRKEVIELFGNYWHNLPKNQERDNERLEAYKKYGYSTLIVWDKELKNIDNVLNKIKEFEYK